METLGRQVTIWKYFTELESSSSSTYKDDMNKEALYEIPDWYKRNIDYLRKGMHEVMVIFTQKDIQEMMQPYGINSTLFNKQSNKSLQKIDNRGIKHMEYACALLYSYIRSGARDPSYIQMIFWLSFSWSYKAMKFDRSLSNEQGRKKMEFILYTGKGIRSSSDFARFHSTAEVISKKAETFISYFRSQGYLSAEKMDYYQKLYEEGKINESSPNYPDQIFKKLIDSISKRVYSMMLRIAEYFYPNNKIGRDVQAQFELEQMSKLNPLSQSGPQKLASLVEKVFQSFEAPSMIIMEKIGLFYKTLDKYKGSTTQEKEVRKKRQIKYAMAITESLRVGDNLQYFGDCAEALIHYWAKKKSNKTYTPVDFESFTKEIYLKAVTDSHLRISDQRFQNSLMLLKEKVMATYHKKYPKTDSQTKLSTEELVSWLKKYVACQINEDGVNYIFSRARIKN